MKYAHVYCRYMDFKGWATLILMVVCSCGLSAQEQPLTIAIIQPYNISAYYEAIEGFSDQLRRELKHDFQIVVYESTEGLHAAMQQRSLTADASDIDLILTVGTQATSDIAQRVQDIPVVFTMVLNADRGVLDAPNVVGASLNIPVELQFSMIKEVLPAAKNVGVIYDPGRNGAFIKESARTARQLGYNLKPFPVTSQKEIPQALERVGKEADVLWGIVDDTVYTSQMAQAIIQFAWKKQIPFIGTSEPYVKAGALWALTFDSKDIGRQSALLAGRILAGSPVAALKETIPRKIGWVLNKRTAKLIGVELSQKLIDQAWVVYE